MTNVPTNVSKVTVGPRRAIPLPIFLFTSFKFAEFKANCANTDAFDKSITSTKKNNASL